MLLTLLLAVFALCLYRVRFYRYGFNEDYLSKDSTNSIKGIFILLIVISHAIPYFGICGYSFDAFADAWVQWFFTRVGQLVVVMFLFYSGYGVGESFKSKGMTYVKAMPRHRILGTLLNFDIAVIAFIVLDFLLGISFTANQCLLSLTGWENVGNSNWYIFVILLCYVMTFITLLLPLSKPIYRVALLFGLCAVCMVVLSQYKAFYWHNTILSYPFGFAYSVYKESIEERLKKSYWTYAIVSIAILLLASVSLHDCPEDRIKVGHNVVSILFALCVVIMSLRVRIDNKPLRWAGKHLFPIYIYMRLPMIVMYKQAPAFVGTYPALFILISLAITLLIARCYKYWEIKL